MKKQYVYLIIFSFFLLSCEKEKQQNILDPITLSLILDYFPDSLYSSADVAVFVNDQEEEKRLDISYEMERVKKEVSGKEYVTEEVSVRLIEKENTDYVIHIYLSGAYGTFTSPAQYFMSAAVYNNITNGRIPLVSFREIDGTIFSDNLVREEMQIHTKMFAEVYFEDHIDEGVRHFAGIYYTIQDGVVAFRDRENALWVLCKYE